MTYTEHVMHLEAQGEENEQPGGTGTGSRIISGRNTRGGITDHMVKI